MSGWIGSRHLAHRQDRRRTRATRRGARRLRGGRAEFEERGLAYDYALVSFDLSLVLLEEGRTAEVRKVAGEMFQIFGAQEVHREALGALHVFCEAARREAATVELTRRVERYLRRARLDPGLLFEEE